MAEIRPFVSIRPQRGKAAEIAALPYDVYNREEATKEVERHPQSFLSIDRAETQFPLSVDMYDDKVYERAHDTLWQWVENGTFLTENKKCYYLYELTMNGRVQTGVAACASIDDYENGVIKKHENTRAEKEVDRIRHVDVCNAQTGPIFLAYRADDGIRRIVEKTKRGEPEYDFTSEDGVRHRVFVIREDADIAAIHEAFAGIDSIYIADGHHRAASAVKVGQKRRKEHPGYTGEEEFNYFLSVLFPDDELMIMDYNRVIRDLNGYSLRDCTVKSRSGLMWRRLPGQRIPDLRSGEPFACIWKDTGFPAISGRRTARRKIRLQIWMFPYCRISFLNRCSASEIRRRTDALISSVESGAWTNWCGAVSRTARWRLQCIRRPLRSCSQWRMRDF